MNGQRHILKIILVCSLMTGGIFGCTQSSKITTVAKKTRENKNTIQAQLPHSQSAPFAKCRGFDGTTGLSGKIDQLTTEEIDFLQCYLQNNHSTGKIPIYQILTNIETNTLLISMGSQNDMMTMRTAIPDFFNRYPMAKIEIINNIVGSFELFTPPLTSPLAHPTMSQQQNQAFKTKDGVDTKAILSPFAVFKKSEVHQAAAGTFTLVYENGCLYGRSLDNDDELRVLLAFEEGYAEYNRKTKVLRVGNRHFKLNEKISLGGGFLDKDISAYSKSRILFMPKCKWDAMWLGY